MRLGAHISAAGGVFKAFERAEAVGCETFMVYTKSNRQWNAKPLAAKDIAKYEQEAAAYAASIFPVVVHAAYLINTASPDPVIWGKSTNAIRDEIERAEALGIERLVMHPGSHMTATIEEGMDNIVRALRQVSAETPGYNVRICLETMAGQGTNLGSTFEQLAYLGVRTVDVVGHGKLSLGYADAPAAVGLTEAERHQPGSRAAIAGNDEFGFSAALQGLHQLR